MNDSSRSNEGRTRTLVSTQSRHMPRWKVILHDDAVNDYFVVARRVHQLTPLSKEEAYASTNEAHTTGRSLLLTTHKERAELYVDQFGSLQPPITVTIEPKEP